MRVGCRRVLLMTIYISVNPLNPFGDILVRLKQHPQCDVRRGVKCVVLCLLSLVCLCSVLDVRDDDL